MSVLPLAITQETIRRLKRPAPPQQEVSLASAVASVANETLDDRVQRSVNSSLHMNGQDLGSQGYPAAQGFDNLVAAIVNMAKLFAKLQSWAASILRASPDQDTDAIKHGLKQLDEAYQLSDIAATLSLFLYKVEANQMNKETPFRGLLASTITGYSDEIQQYFTAPILNAVQAIYGSDYVSGGDTATTLGQIMDRKAQFQVQPDTDGFKFVSNESPVMSAEQIEAVNAIFNKACEGDLITLAA